MPKGVPNKRYTAEFKRMVVKTMQREKISYNREANVKLNFQVTEQPHGNGFT